MPFPPVSFLPFLPHSYFSLLPLLPSLALYSPSWLVKPHYTPNCWVGPGEPKTGKFQVRHQHSECQAGQAVGAAGQSSEAGPECSGRPLSPGNLWPFSCKSASWLRHLPALGSLWWVRQNSLCKTSIFIMISNTASEVNIKYFLTPSPRNRCLTPHATVGPSRVELLCISLWSCQRNLSYSIFLYAPEDFLRGSSEGEC